MQGSIQKRVGKHGATWSVVYDDPTAVGRRKQRRKTFQTKKEAEAFLAKTIHQINTGGFIEPNSVTLGEYMAFWLDSYAQHNVRPTTYRSYEQMIRVHILPMLGGIELQRLQPAHLQGFYSQKLVSGRADGKPGGLAPRTVKYLHMIVREALQQAVKWQLVPRNVADATEPPRAARAQVHAWDAEAALQFLEAAAGDTYSPVWLLALTTGMRRGELLGLRWQDVDLAKCVVHVRQSLVEVGGRLVFQEPKTASGRRTVVLSPTAVTALREHRTRQLERRLSLGPVWRDHDLVITTSDGAPVTPSNLRRSFVKLVKDADVPPIRFHDLRHTHATLLLKEGMHAKIVSERLGHANIAITLDTYSHVLPSMQQQAAEGIDRALFGT